ncbi:helix-turn-helix domain-containing protein [uncultured Alistipes sp.]|uniref:helix-turn-helix domain-containing protein n=1 Tax=uncultured Alistipes sp. TaxID=538949 RepID=UPI0025D24E1B|nr:helix-turn-helix domain-containing protein [uncultured Alistipes sp.]
MGGKEYRDYWPELRAELGVFTSLDHGDTAQVLSKLRDVAKAYGDPAWELMAALFEKHYALYRTYPDYVALAADFEYIAAQTKRLGSFHIRMMALKELAYLHRYGTKNYELAFEFYRQIESELQSVPQSEFPEKPEYYYEIADYHYQFGDYEKAAVLFRLILQSAPTSYNERIFIHARNGLGLCCRYDKEDFDESDKWFSSILGMEMSSADKETQYRQWEGIANGNLGYNQYLRGNYPQAVPLLKFSVERAEEYRDLAFAARMAVPLAESYRHAGNRSAARRYLDQAGRYYDAVSAPQYSRRLLYEAMCRYYMDTGNAALSARYLDSMTLAREVYDKDFNALRLLRAEQRANIQEQRAIGNELRMETLRSRTYKRNMIFGIAGSTILAGLLLLYYILYRRKRTAYRMLLERSRQWAAQPAAAVRPGMPADAAVSDEDLALMERLNGILSDRNVYLNGTLSLPGLAAMLGTNRTYLSEAVNRVTGDNFNVFINNARVREAIRLMSDPAYDKLSMDAIWLDAGFNSRQTFWIAFKKTTGLTPSYFRRHHGNR